MKIPDIYYLVQLGLSIFTWQTSDALLLPSVVPHLLQPVIQIKQHICKTYAMAKLHVQQMLEIQFLVIPALEQVNI